MSDTTDAPAHASAIIAAIDARLDEDGSFTMIGKATALNIRDHAAALDAARVAAEQRAEHLAERLDRICRIACDAHDERADRLAAIEEIYAIAYGDLDAAPAPGRADGGTR